MAEVYHFNREYVLWKLTYPQIHAYLDSHAKKQPPDPNNPASAPTPTKPASVSALKGLGFKTRM